MPFERIAELVDLGINVDSTLYWKVNTMMACSQAKKCFVSLLGRNLRTVHHYGAEQVYNNEYTYCI